jgi:hypothetical protein
MILIEFYKGFYENFKLTSPFRVGDNAYITSAFPELLQIL